MSHAWLRRVLTHALLPPRLVRSIMVLTQRQQSILYFAGLTFDPFEVMCGLKQGGPLSGYLYVVCVAPFLFALSRVDGVLHVSGFCDDWAAHIVGLRPVRHVVVLICEFEHASGQSINRTKTAFVPSRALLPNELRTLRQCWEGAKVTDNQRYLGTPFGHNVGIGDFIEDCQARFEARIREFRNARLSFTMRILAVNVFMFPLFSYICRIVILPESVVRSVVNSAVRFVTPVTFAKPVLLHHMRRVFKMSIALRHFKLDNVAAVLATALRLEARGSINERMKQTWREDRNDIAESGVFRPLSHVAEAYSFFQAKVGSSPEQSVGAHVNVHGRRDTTSSVHRSLYEKLLGIDATEAETYIEQRMSVIGFHAEPLLANLKRCPSTVPNGHRIIFLRFCFNELPTTRRRHFLNHGSVQPCAFCGEAHGDDIHHWHECERLRDAFASIYGQAVVRKLLSPNGVMMQCEMSGNEIAMLMAWIHAIWKCRNVITHGDPFFDFGDFCTHLRSIVEDPWIHGLVATTTRRERRAARVQPPEEVAHGYIFYSDGASRSREFEERLGSCGALLIKDGGVAGRWAEFIGDVTNNYAEYTGVIRCLERAATLPREAIVFRVDSMLVANQLGGTWACRSTDLRPLYEKAVRLLQMLQQNRENAGEIRVQHVYREFNRDADGLANEAIDSYDRSIHTNGIVVDDRWTLSDD